jgi:hypothetical protein
VVGAFPEPFVHGIAGKRVPTRVECADPESAACGAVATRLTDQRVLAARGGIGAGVNDETLRVLVGTWSSLMATGQSVVTRVADGPAASGVFARFTDGGRTLNVLDAKGRDADELRSGTGLIAATKVEDKQPVWFVTGTDEAGVEAAARTLDEATLTTDYALAVHDDRGVPVPAR